MSVCARAGTPGGSCGPLPGPGRPLDARPVLYRLGTRGDRAGTVRTSPCLAEAEPAPLPGTGRSAACWLGALPTGTAPLCVAARPGVRSALDRTDTDAFPGTGQHPLQYRTAWSPGTHAPEGWRSGGSTSLVGRVPDDRQASRCGAGYDPCRVRSRATPGLAGRCGSSLSPVSGEPEPAVQARCLSMQHRVGSGGFGSSGGGTWQAKTRRAALG